MLSVYTRHHPDCKNAGDKAWRRCNCPKWIWGSVNGNFIRRSARTPNWDEAEELRLRLQQEVTQPALPAPQAAEPSPPPIALALPPPIVQEPLAGEVLPPAPKRPRITIKEAVESYLADAVSRNVAEATLDKLTTIFEKRFLPWTQAQGLEYIDEIELDSLLNFRNLGNPNGTLSSPSFGRITGSNAIFPQPPDPGRRPHPVLTAEEAEKKTGEEAPGLIPLSCGSRHALSRSTRGRDA